MIPCQRHLFEMPEDVAFFNCAALAPILKSSRDAGLVSVTRKAQPWHVGSAERIGEPDQARALFAGLIGAAAQDIAIIPAASYGIATAAANLPVKPGQTIVLLEDQYPNNVLPWIQKRAREGAELIFVVRPEDDDLTAGILEAIDERTAIVALPHCFWTDGTLIDLAAVGRRCREVGAALVVDATQSVGALPFDVAEIRPDFLIVSGYKWLLCPYTIGFLYVAPQRQDGVPLEHSWRDGMLEGWGVDWRDGHMDYPEGWQPGAGRFNMGETANFISMPMAIKALEQMHAWEVAEINASLRRITETIIERTDNFGLVAPNAKHRAGHMTGLRLAAGADRSQIDELEQRLADKQIYLSVRGDSLRIAPHLHVNNDDIDRLVSALADSL
jgi:selenocysteine lyase/cysteine desulfurase